MIQLYHGSWLTSCLQNVKENLNTCYLFLGDVGIKESLRKPEIIRRAKHLGLIAGGTGIPSIVCCCWTVSWGPEQFEFNAVFQSSYSRFTRACSLAVRQKSIFSFKFIFQFASVYLFCSDTTHFPTWCINLHVGERSDCSGYPFFIA